jgi:hypothetical protein
MMKNNAWFFGDSFTAGDGCRPEDEYYELYPEKRSLMWTELVANKLNMVCINKGISGASNDKITNNLIEYLSEIKSGDFVSVSVSHPIRVDFFSKDGSLMSSTTAPSEDYAIQNLTPKEREIITDYIINFRLYYSDFWEDYYIKRYENFKKFFNEVGIKMIIWDAKVFYSKTYEDITTNTNGIIRDNHLSWIGHKQAFYMFFMSQIKTKTI